MIDYTFTINGVDCSGYVDKTSYRTSLIPVYTDTITTLDGVGHTKLIRKKGTVKFAVNALKQSDLQSIVSAIFSSVPIVVEYHCLQRNTDVTANMVPDELTARYLPYCIYGTEDWNAVDEITLVEL